MLDPPATATPWLQPPPILPLAAEPMQTPSATTARWPRRHCSAHLTTQTDPPCTGRSDETHQSEGKCSTHQPPPPRRSSHHLYFRSPPHSFIRTNVSSTDRSNPFLCEEQHLRSVTADQNMHYCGHIEPNPIIASMSLWGAHWRMKGGMITRRSFTPIVRRSDAAVGRLGSSSKIPRCVLFSSSHPWGDEFLIGITWVIWDVGPRKTFSGS
jgi:hypothetical protein